MEEDEPDALGASVMKTLKDLFFLLVLFTFRRYPSFLPTRLLTLLYFAQTALSRSATYFPVYIYRYSTTRSTVC